MSEFHGRGGGATTRANGSPTESGPHRVTTVQKAGIGVVVVALLGLATAVVNFAASHVGTSPSGSPSPTSVSASVPPGLPNATIYLSKDSVPYGATFTVSGEGFAPNEKVQIRIDTFDVASPTANAQGGFANVQVSIPSFYKPFQKPMTVDVIASSDPSFPFSGRRQIVIT